MKIDLNLAGKVVLGRFGPRIRVTSVLGNPPDAVPGTRSEVVEGGMVEWLEVTIPADEDFTRYHVQVEGGWGGYVEPSDVPVRVAPISSVTVPTDRRFTWRGESVAGGVVTRGRQRYGVFTQFPAGEEEEGETAIVVTGTPSITFNPSPEVGAIYTVVLPEFTGGPVVDTEIRLFISDDAFATETEVDFEPGGAVDAAWEGFELRAQVVYANDIGATTPVRSISYSIAEEEDEPVPPPATVGQWSVVAKVADTAGKYVLGYTFDVEAHAVEWANSTSVDDDANWNPCAWDSEDEAWYHLIQDGTAERERDNGTSASILALRYRLTPTGPISPPSIDRKTGSDALIETPAPEPGVGHVRIHSRTQQEFQLGSTGGDGEQFFHGMARSVSNPDYIMGYQDTGGPVRSQNDGRFWKHLAPEGLMTYFCDTGEIDPADHRVQILVSCSKFTASQAGNFEGIWRTADGWATPPTLARQIAGVGFRRTSGPRICYEPQAATAATPTTRKWDALVMIGEVTRTELWQSNNGGQTWSKTRDLSVSEFGRPNTLWAHPTLPNVRFLCTSSGFWVSTNRGVNWTKKTIRAGSPNAQVNNIAINPAGGALASTEIYAVTTGELSVTSLARSTDGGDNWTQITIPTNFPATKIYVSRTDGAWPAVGSRILHLVGRGGGAPRRSANGGASWTTPTVAGRPGSGAGWTNSISDADSTSINAERLTHFMIHPDEPLRIVVHSKAHIFRSTDGGQSYHSSQEGFSGKQSAWRPTSMAFCAGEGLHDHILIGNTDSGMEITRNGCSWMHNSPGDAKNPQTGADLKRSSLVVAISPTDPMFMISAFGFKEAARPSWLFRANGRDYPTSQSLGHWYCINPDRPDYTHTFLHWHDEDDGRVYAAPYRFANAMAPNPASVSLQSYGSGFGGQAVCPHPADNDVVYSWSNSAKAVTRSINQGGSFSPFFTISWNIYEEDLRQPWIAPHPTDPDTIFTRSAAHDLARFSFGSGTWKTDYNILGRFRADYPGSVGVPARLSMLAIDPSDANVGAVGVRCPGWSAMYVTTNLQASSPTWTNITMNLPRHTAPVIRFDKHRGHLWMAFSAIGGIFLAGPFGARSVPPITSKFKIF